MYLHLGYDTVVHSDDVIGIFDLDNTTVQKNTREYLAEAERMGQVVNITEEIPKSFVVCIKEGKQKIYISQISSATLKKRSGRDMIGTAEEY